VDAALQLVASSPRTVWSGLDRFNDSQVWLIADDQPVRRTVVSGGSVTLPFAATKLVAGFAFTHVVEPSPVLPLANRAQDARYRTVRMVFRLLATTALHLDMGNGPIPQALPTLPDGFTGDRAVRVLGWRRGIDAPFWQIAQDDPTPFTLLAVTHQLQVTD
jgi:hypothetical protein